MSYWFNEVPNDWSIVKIKNIFSLVNGGTPKSDVKEYWSDSEVVWVTPEDLSKEGKYLENSTRKISYLGLQNCSAKYIKANSIVLSCRAPIGNVKVSAVPFTTNQGCKSLESKVGVNIDFYYYLICLAKEHLNALGQGTTFLELSNHSLKNLYVPYPDIKLQNRIAHYLDDKCKQIDKLVISKKKQLRLLEKQRQSIITEAVIKGLNPNVKMKDSGVEWIGEIPEHWEKLRIKNVASISGRIGFRGYTTQDIVDEGNGAITLSPSNIQNGMMHYDKVTYISWEKYFESPEIMLNEDYLIFCKTGSSYGKVAILKELYEPMTINPQLVVIKPCSILPDYLYYVLESDLGKVQVELIVGGGTMPTINQEDIIKIIVTFPPYEEQKQIVEFLNNKIEEILTTITDIKLQINKLKEYRQSLIYEAVTGKIDVREMEREVSEVSKDGCGYVREGI